MDRAASSLNDGAGDGRPDRETRAAPLDRGGAARASTVAPFADSLQHLLAELERVDLMVRARVAQLRRLQSQDEHFHGLYISEDEVDALIERPIGMPQWLMGAGAGPPPSPGLSDAAAASAPGTNEGALNEAALELLRDRIARRCEASAAAGIELRLPRLARTFGLDDFDVDALLVTLAVEIDLRYERLYAYLQDDVTKKRPSVSLLLALLASDGTRQFDARRRLAATAPLLRHRLLRLFEDPSLPNSPLLARVVKVDDRIVRFLLGGMGKEEDDDDLDDELRDVVRLLVPDRGLDTLLLDASQRMAWRVAVPSTSAAPGATRSEGETLVEPGAAWPEAEAAASRAVEDVAGRELAGPAVVLIDGAAGSGRTSLPLAICRERGWSLLVVDVAAAATAGEGTRPEPAPGGRWTQLAQAVEREALLRGAAVLWRGSGAIVDDVLRGGLVALWRAVDAGRAPCFVVDGALAREPSGFARRGTVALRVPLASAAQRMLHWKQALAGAVLADDVDLGAIAARFKLSFGRIDEAAATARRSGATIAQRDLQDACRLHSNQRLSSLARKTATHHTWQDIVLPDERLSQLREICNQVKYRERVYGDWGFGAKLSLGKGLAVLFAGPSGTGKTMSAGIIASELGLDLYKIDLSTVVSKYIGETEKNLSRIFDEAETSNAILFFDEADALFGKRSEVRDSHDRYANIEVGYLLQRMEEYEGIAILATNLRKNMDDAFVRRLHFTVEFPFPDAFDRHRIWQAIWPDDMPREATLDLKELADRYEMTGGNIRNVALAAAFLAADDEPPVVRMEHVARAVLREYQKSGRLMGDYGDSAAPRVRARR